MKALDTVRKPFPLLRSVAALAMAAICFVLCAPSAAQAQTESVEYYGLDAVGSVRVVFDASGNVLARMDYGPFGEQLAPSTGKQRNIYAGLFVDEEPGTDHADARDYQVRTARFTAADPVYAGLFNPQAWNRYAYALNNPVSFSDPTGLQVESQPPSCKQQSLDRGEDGAFRVTSNCPGGGGSGDGGSSSTGPSAGMMDMLNWLAMKLLDVASFNSAVVYAPEIEPQASGNVYHPSRGVELAVDASVLVAAVATGTGAAVARGMAAEEAATVTASEGTTIYRAFGGDARPFGRSWALENPLTVSNYRAAAGLPSANTGQFLIEAKLLTSVGWELRPALPGPLTTRLTTPVTELFFSAPPKPGVDIMVHRVTRVIPPF